MNIEKQQRIVKLRKLETSDTKEVAILMNNKKIWDNLRNHIPFPYTETDAENFIELVKDDNSQKTFAIEYNNKFCGIISLILLTDIYDNSAELGYWVGEPFWNKGITSETVKQISDYGFNKLKLRRIFANVFEFNIASMKVLEKNGYLKEGILIKAVLKNKKVLDEHRYYKLNKMRTL